MATQTKVVTQAQGQTRVVPPARLIAYEIEKNSNQAVGQIIAHSICLVFSLIVLISASVTLTAIDSIFDFVDEYENSRKYRGAAGWLLFVAITAIIFHSMMIFIRLLYYTSTIVNNFSGYAFINGILCIVFGLAFLSGAVPNAKYASDNSDVYDVGCSFDNSAAYCHDLERLYISEAVSAAFSIASLMTLVPLIIVILCMGIQKLQQANRGSSVITASAPPYTPLLNNN